MVAFMWILQEGRITRTLIGMIHSTAKLNYQLAFHIDATATDTFLYLRQDWMSSLSYEDIPVVPSHSSLPIWGLCSLATCHSTNHCPRNSDMLPLSLVCRQEKQGIIHSIWNLSGWNWSGCRRNFRANLLSKLKYYGYHHLSNRTHAHPQGPTRISGVAIAPFPLSLLNSICEASAKNEKWKLKLE